MRKDLEELLKSMDEDFSLAKIALEMKLFRSSVFHSHQCVEKLLKAYLLYRKGKYPFTHSLSKLLKECLEVEKTFQN